MLISALLIGAASGASALKFSDRAKVDEAMRAIQMADLLASATPLTIECRIPLPTANLGPPQQRLMPQVVLQSGTPAFTSLLSAMTTKLNADKATAQSYLASVGVTND
jgi:hypothetical protein